jgi:hypothetical protein
VGLSLAAPGLLLLQPQMLLHLLLMLQGTDSTCKQQQLTLVWPGQGAVVDSRPCLLPLQGSCSSKPRI